MKKRLLSVALILSMLASLLMVGVAGPASAVRETFTTAVSLIDYESLTPKVNLTFEGEETEKYGIPFGRNLAGNVSYKTDDGHIQFLTASSRAIFFGKDGSVGKEIVTSGAANAADAVANLYPFEKDKTYTVKFDIKARSGKAVKQGYTFNYGLVADPNASPITAKGGMDASSIVESNLPLEYKVNGSVVADGTVLETDTDWETVTITFKVSTAGNFGINYNDTVQKVVAIDNVKVYDITDEVDKSVTIKTDYVSYDMTGVTVNSNATGTPNGDFVAHQNKSATVVPLGSEDAHGDVLQLTDATRGTFVDSNVFVKGKKFYISFDGRSMSGAAQAMSLWFANLKHTDGRITYGSMDTNNRYQFTTSSPFEFYINGNKLESYDDFKLSTDWQHFGIVIDLTDSDVLASIASDSSNKKGDALLDTAKYFYFGVANSQYDNFKIISTHDVDNALSEVKDSNFTYEKVVYENDMSSATLNQSTANCASVSNGEVNVTNGRFAVADSNVITANHKYTISFDAKLNDESVESARMYLILSSSTNSMKTRYMFDSANGKIPDTRLWVKDAFTLYIDGVKTAYEDFALNNKSRRYTIKFDFTNANFLELANGTGDMGGLASDPCYFYVGAVNASSFDNFQIAEEPVGTYVEPSTRKAMTTEEGDYLSAGLRFKASVPNSLIESSTEIGFVAAPSSSASLTEDWYKLDNGVNKIARKGIVYVKDGYNYAYSTEGCYTDYQLVITGLSAEEDGKLEGKTAYNRRYSVVVYAKDAKDNYTYSAVGEASYYQVLGMSTILGE